MQRIIAATARRAGDSRWGLLFVLVVLLAAAGLGLAGKNPLTALILVAATLLAWLTPALARALVPVLLAALGVWGFVLAALYHAGDQREVLYGAVLAGAYSGRAWLVVPQPAVFLGLSLWLVRRTRTWDGWRPSPRRWRATEARGWPAGRWPWLGWGLLLIPLAVQAFALFGSSGWTWGGASSRCSPYSCCPGWPPRWCRPHW